MSDGKPLYPEQDHMALGDYYLRHVDAMTGEGLHAKSDIAAQLAWRDQRIAELERALGELVALEDLRILIRMAEAHPLGTAFEDMSAEYNRRKPAVLAAARALAAREVLP